VSLLNGSWDRRKGGILCREDIVRERDQKRGRREEGRKLKTDKPWGYIRGERIIEKLGESRKSEKNRRLEEEVKTETDEQVSGLTSNWTSYAINKVSLAREYK